MACRDAACNFASSSRRHSWMSASHSCAAAGGLASAPAPDGCCRSSLLPAAGGVTRRPSRSITPSAAAGTKWLNTCCAACSASIGAPRSAASGESYTRLAVATGGGATLLLLPAGRRSSCTLSCRLPADTGAATATPCSCSWYLQQTSRTSPTGRHTEHRSSDAKQHARGVRHCLVQHQVPS